MFIDYSAVLAPDSAEHWLMIQEFRADTDGAHPDDVFGPDGYLIYRAPDGSTALGLTEIGIRRVEEIAVQSGGAGELARLDQCVAGLRDQQGTDEGPAWP